MKNIPFPVIDPDATGANILRLRKQRGLSVREMQLFFGFEEPQAIYKWQRGKSLPSIDNLYALSALLEVPVEGILVPSRPKLDIVTEQQASACCSVHFRYIFPNGQPSGMRRWSESASVIFAPWFSRGAVKQAPESALFLVWGRRVSAKVCG